MKILFLHNCTKLSFVVVVLGFSQLEYTTSEKAEVIEVTVEVLFGQLERSVAVLVNSTYQSTATPGQGISHYSVLIVVVDILYTILDPLSRLRASVTNVGV